MPVYTLWHSAITRRTRRVRSGLAMRAQNASFCARMWGRVFAKSELIRCSPKFWESNPKGPKTEILAHE